MPAQQHDLPEFLVAGHVTQDLVGEELRPGGTASYAAVVASRLGLRTAILTSAAEDFTPPEELAGVTLHRLAAARTTVMEHRWHGRLRDQFVRSRAETLSAAAVPTELRSVPIVLVGPVTDEASADLPRAFPRSLRGGTIQGWLRRVAADGHVEPLEAVAWDYQPVLSELQAAFLSEEDLGADAQTAAAVIDGWAKAVPILAVTRGDTGASISVNAQWYQIAAMPADERDSTGAGDAFAAAFLIRYHETADTGEAARFATAVASFVVEAPGIAGAPTRQQVEARLAACPDVRLRREGSRQ